MTELDRRIMLLRERLMRATSVASILSNSSDLRDVQFIQDQLDLAAEELDVIRQWAKAVSK